MNRIETIAIVISKNAKEPHPFEIGDEWVQNDAYFSGTLDQITDYCSGKLKNFNVTINPRGTEFQKKVWRKLTGIPYGELRGQPELV